MLQKLTLILIKEKLKNATKKFLFRHFRAIYHMIGGGTPPPTTSV
ncbi:MAG: hypothetical protein AB1546_05960 [bacterium]